MYVGEKKEETMKNRKEAKFFLHYFMLPFCIVYTVFHSVPFIRGGGGGGGYTRTVCSSVAGVHSHPSIQYLGLTLLAVALCFAAHYALEVFF